MKPDEYKVKYCNGMEQTFYCFGFTYAVIVAMYYAIQKGLDANIEYITDGQKTIENITFPKYDFIK